MVPLRSQLFKIVSITGSVAFLGFLSMLKYTYFQNIHVAKPKDKRILCTKRIHSYYLQNYCNISDSCINPTYFHTSCLTAFNIQL